MIPPLSMTSRWISSNEEAEVQDAGQPMTPHRPELLHGSNGHHGALVIHLGGWQIHRALDCRGRKLEKIENSAAARLWLQTLSKDPLTMNVLRSVLREEGLAFPEVRWRDEDVVLQLAYLIGRGVWHVCEPVMRLHALSASAGEAPVFFVPRRVPGASNSLSSAPQPMYDPPAAPTLAANADHAAIAANLTAASHSGVPFCEECAKAAAARAAAAKK